MKKSIFYIAIILIIFSCDSALEVEIQDSFDFEITTNQNEISFIANKIKTTLSINPERIVTGTEYYFSYSLVNGNGYYLLNNEILSPNQEYKLSSLRTDLFYTGDNVDTHQTKLQIRNDDDLLVEHLISYKLIDQTNFNFSITKSTNEVFFTENILLNFDIQKLSNEIEEDLLYSLKYVSSSLNGALKINGNDFDPGETISNLSEGNFEGIYTAETPGNFQLLFLATASNGKQQEVSVDFTIKQTDFSFNMTPSKQSNYVNEIANFQLEIEKTGVENLTYKLRFSGQSGIFTFQGNEYRNIDDINVPLGNSSLSYKPIEITNTPLEFTLTASNGVVKTLTVNYESLPTNFEVVAPTSLENSQNFNIFFIANIIPPEVQNQFLSYKFYYTTEGLGSVKLDETNTNTQGIQAGQVVELEGYTNLRLSLRQLGSISERNGKLILHIIDNNGVSRTKEIDITWY